MQNQIAQEARQISPYQAISNFVCDEAQLKQIKIALPSDMPADRFARTFLTYLKSNEHLLHADRGSLFNSYLQAAQDGLMCDGRDCALVTYDRQVKYMPMIAGVIKKIYKTGLVYSLSAHIVYEGDQFAYVLGDNERLDHVPNLTSPRIKAIFVYAILKFKDGRIYREVMTADEVETVRRLSKSTKKPGPWETFWGEMAKKTVIRRMLKRLPLGEEIDTVFRDDDDIIENKVEQVTQLENQQPATGGPSRLKSFLSAQQDITPTVEETENDNA